jgi:hypothetical protein
MVIEENEFIILRLKNKCMNKKFLMIGMFLLNAGWTLNAQEVNVKREGEDQYFVSDAPENFKELGELFLGFELEDLQEVNLEK